MGVYINPGNEGFRQIVADEYVDKTGLIALVNATIGKPRPLVCVTRPRRFGKSFSAQMLVAYFCQGCDSDPLFEGLAIKKDASFSQHLNAYHVIRLDLTSFTSSVYAPYVGFTEDEVRMLCDRHGMDFEGMRRWYDGYDLFGVGPVYAPNSVMEACRRCRFGSYWSSTESYTSLARYIQMDFDGLQDMVADLIAGERIPVNTMLFRNDMDDVQGADDVLTLLAHLGYLAYEEDSQTVRIPNEEVRLEFAATIRAGGNLVLTQMVADADRLLRATIEGDEDAVAVGIARAHDSRLGPDWYNDEQALRFAVKLAYLSAVDKFAEIEELPSGHGYADLVYLPKRYARVPALLVELKWNKPVSGALDQIRARNYPKVLADYGGPLLLVGITYDTTTKVHTCSIERMRK